MTSTKKQHLLTKIIDMELETLRLFKEGKIKALRFDRSNTAITFDQSIKTNQQRIDFLINLI
jgi:hypothetical protein